LPKSLKNNFKLNRWISIFLLTLFLYNSIGHFLLLGGTLCTWKHEVKHSIIQTIKENDLVKISLSEKVKLLDRARELEYNGIRYDVVKKNDTHFFCFQDEKETHLIKKMLGSIVHKASNYDDYSSDFSILKNIFKIYFIENQYFIHFFYKKMKLLIFEHPSFFDCFVFYFFIPPIAIR
jgi:hypothetical protein